MPNPSTLRCARAGGVPMFVEFGEKSDLTFYRIALTFPAVNPSTKMKLKNGTLN